MATCGARFDAYKRTQLKQSTETKVVEEGIEEVLSVRYIVQA